MTQTTVIERVEADLQTARRARDNERLQALSTLLSALRDAQKDARGELDSAGEIAVLRTERKRRAEAAASYREGGREEDALREEAKGSLIDDYLPAALDEAELDRLVAAAVAETGASSPKELGAVMKVVLPRVAGRADGKEVSAAVRRALG